MKRGCVKTTHPLFCFIKNVFLNRHSRHYRIDNLNLRFALLTFVISATTSMLSPIYSRIDLMDRSRW